MSWRTTTILFALLLIVGGYVYWQNQQDAAPEPELSPVAEVAESVGLVTGAALEDVRRLEVSRREDGLAVSYTRDAEGVWSQTVPTMTQVISQTMEFAAGNLVTITSRRSLPAAANPLAAYGLEDPSYQIVLALLDVDGRLIRHTFYLGDTLATGDGRYVQKQGDARIHIVAGYVFDPVIELLDTPPVRNHEDEQESPLQPFFELPPDPAP
jgi:hypothetical protein